MATVAGRGVERARKDPPKKSAAPISKASDDEVRQLAFHLYERRCASSNSSAMNRVAECTSISDGATGNSKLSAR